MEKKFINMTCDQCNGKNRRLNSPIRHRHWCPVITGIPPQPRSNYPPIKYFHEDKRPNINKEDSYER